jgi:multidrug efflux pump subunit AcrB
MPLSVLPTFWAMEALGLLAELVSLLAITLVTGILVDDAIVEIENIVRHMRMGKSALSAALEAADEIGLAVVATTMTIVAVFLPVSFMGGIAGQYFKQFGLTVAVAVLFSLLVARLVTPLMAAYLMRDKAHADPRDGMLMRFYLRLLGWSIRHRGRTIALGFAIFVASVGLASLFPTGLLPNNDISRSSLAIELPPGSTLEDTQAVADRLAALLRQQPEVSSVYAVVGGAGLNPLDIANGEVREATLVATLVPRAERSMDQKAWESAMRPKIAAEPDLRFSFSAGGAREFTLLLSGNDSVALDHASMEIEREIRDRVPVLANVVSTASIDRPEIRIMPRLAEAAALGVSVAQIAETVRIRRPDDGLCGAGAAVRHLPAADHHPVLAAALDRRRDRRAAPDRQAAHGAGVDRHPDADGHRHQERHHAGGIRGRIDPRRQAARRGDHRRRHEARAPDRHDHDRDGRRHDAVRAGRSAPAANSARRWRWP